MNKTMVGEPIVETSPTTNSGKYRCTLCGHIHEGELTEDFACPVCNVGIDLFITLENKVVEEKVEDKKYQCTICNYIHDGELEDGYTCPICKMGTDKFKQI